MKPVMSVDDLALVLQHHWILDDSAFDDERQRVQLASLLLVAAYTGQRPCSLLETTRKRGPLQAVKTGDEYLEDSSEDEQSEHENRTCAEAFEDCDYDAVETPTRDNLPRGILYRDVRIRVLPRRFDGQRNPLVMEMTIVHTKGEDRTPQP